jgi:hypothetical protein
MKKMLAIVAVGVTVALGMTGCGKATEPFKDAPGSAVVNDAPMDKVLMSDGFSNVGTKCDHGNRIYVAFHGDSTYAAIAIVPQDPTCR